MIELLKERATFVKDFWEQGSFFFVAPTEYAPKAVNKQWKEQTPNLLLEVINVLQNISDFKAENIKEKLSEWISLKKTGFGKVMQPLRLSLVGDMKGPDLFVIMELLGRDEVIKRVKKALNMINK